MSWKLTAARLADRGLRLLLSPDQRIALGNYLVTLWGERGREYRPGDKRRGPGVSPVRRCGQGTRGRLDRLRRRRDVGDRTYHCAAALGSGSRVFAFEPVRPTLTS